jgi:uncharacterized membrane protein YhfC
MPGLKGINCIEPYWWRRKARLPSLKVISINAFNFIKYVLTNEIHVYIKHASDTYSFFSVQNYLLFFWINITTIYPLFKVINLYILFNFTLFLPLHNKFINLAYCVSDTVLISRDM